MPTLEVDVDGAQRLATDLARAAAELPEAADAALGDWARTWSGLAVKLAPKRTGRLAASHRTATTFSGVVVSNDAPYAGAVYARNPWLARALTQTTPDAVAALERTLTDAVTT